jgi:hypothetical protein
MLSKDHFTVSTSIKAWYPTVYSVYQYLFLHLSLSAYISLHICIYLYISFSIYISCQSSMSLSPSIYVVLFSISLFVFLSLFNSLSPPPRSPAASVYLSIYSLSIYHSLYPFSYIPLRLFFPSVPLFLPTLPLSPPSSLPPALSNNSYCRIVTTSKMMTFQSTKLSSSKHRMIYVEISHLPT